MATRARVVTGDADAAAKVPPTLWNRDFILICLYNLVIFISLQMLMPTIPVYISELGGNEVIIGLVTGCFTVFAVLVRFWAGRGLDLYGRFGILFLGSVFFALSVMGYYWAITIPLLIVFRAIHGVTWGVVTTAAATAATDLIPQSRRGEGMGFFGLGTSLGVASGPALGFVIIDAFGFPALFWSSAALALVAMLLVTAIRLPRIDVAQGGSVPVLWEPSALRPSLLMFFVAFIFGGVSTFIALYGMELGISNPGVFFTFYAVTVIVTRPVAGAFFDCCGHRVIIIPGFLLLAAGMLILSCSAGLTIFLLAAVVTGMGLGTLQPVLQSLSVAYCAPNRRGAAQATFTAAFDVGLGAGAVMLGLLAPFTDYSGIYLVSTVMALSGILVYRVLGVSLAASQTEIP